MGIGRRTADRYWAYARAWLCDALSRDESVRPTGRKIGGTLAHSGPRTEH